MVKWHHYGSVTYQLNTKNIILHLFKIFYVYLIFAAVLFSPFLVPLPCPPDHDSSSCPPRGPTSLQEDKVWLLDSQDQSGSRGWTNIYLDTRKIFMWDMFYELFVIKWCFLEKWKFIRISGRKCKWFSLKASTQCNQCNSFTRVPLRRLLDVTIPPMLPKTRSGSEKWGSIRVTPTYSSVPKNLTRALWQLMRCLHLVSRFLVFICGTSSSMGSCLCWDMDRTWALSLSITASWFRDSASNL